MAVTLVAGALTWKDGLGGGGIDEIRCGWDTPPTIPPNVQIGDLLVCVSEWGQWTGEAGWEVWDAYDGGDIAEGASLIATGEYPWTQVGIPFADLGVYCRFYEGDPNEWPVGLHFTHAFIFALRGVSRAEPFTVVATPPGLPSWGGSPIHINRGVAPEVWDENDWATVTWSQPSTETGSRGTRFVPGSLIVLAGGNAQSAPQDLVVDPGTATSQIVHADASLNWASFAAAGPLASGTPGPATYSQRTNPSNPRPPLTGTYGQIGIVQASVQTIAFAPPHLTATDTGGGLSGERAAGTTVTVECPTGTVGTVSYPTSTTWAVALSDLAEGSNLATVSDGTDTIEVEAIGGAGPHTLRVEASGPAIYATIAPGADASPMAALGALRVPGLAASPPLPALSGRGLSSPVGFAALHPIPALSGAGALGIPEILSAELGHRIRAVAGGAPVIVNVVPGADVPAMAASGGAGAISVGAQIPFAALAGEGAMALPGVALEIGAMEAAGSIGSVTIAAAPTVPVMAGSGTMAEPGLADTTQLGVPAMSGAGAMAVPGVMLYLPAMAGAGAIDAPWISSGTDLPVMGGRGRMVHIVISAPGAVRIDVYDRSPRMLAYDRTPSVTPSDRSPRVTAYDRSDT